MIAILIASAVALFFGAVLVGAFGNAPRVVLLLGIQGAMILLLIAAPKTTDELNRIAIPGVVALLVINIAAVLAASWLRKNQTVWSSQNLPAGFHKHTKFAVTKNGEVIGWCTFDNLSVYMSTRPDCECRLWNDMDEARSGI